MPLFLQILISKFHSSIQLYGNHNRDVLIDFPIIAAETFSSGSPAFILYSKDFHKRKEKKKKKKFLVLKGKDAKHACDKKRRPENIILANHMA